MSDLLNDMSPEVVEKVIEAFLSARQVVPLNSVLT